MKKEDELIGKKFEKLTILERDKTKKTAARYWICQCECGNIKSIRSSELLNGKVKSCGCYLKEKAKKNIDTTSLVGKVFGRLTVIERDLSKEIGHGKNSYWVCKCDCGNTKSIISQSLLNGHTQSCGCIRTEMLTIDIKGIRSGSLTVLEKTEYKDSRNSFLWKCQCDCGKIILASAIRLSKGEKRSCGCTRKKSLGEEEIENILYENEINFKKEYSFNDCINPKTNMKLRYDFAIFENDKIIRLIEFDGKQHYEISGGWSTEDNFEKIQFRDGIKNNYAKDHHIPLVRIPYTFLNKITLDMLLFDDTFLIK